MSCFKKLGKSLKHLHIVDSDGKSDTHFLPGGKYPAKRAADGDENYEYQEVLL